MLTSKKILIVDDDRGASAVLAARLRRLGCEVLPVVDTLDDAGNQALRELPSVVLVALTTVGGTGGGLGDVRGRFPMPVLFIASNNEVASALGLEACDYVLAGGGDRELHLLLTGVWAKADATGRLHELEARFTEEQAFGDLGRVTGEVAHKINNLLMALTSNTALLRMDDALKAPARAQLDKIDEAVERSAELCRQLLDRVRREKGTLAALTDATESAGPGAINGKAGSKPAGIHGTVLIVDDDESVRALARWVVERAGYPAMTARDGDEALEKFRADPGAFGLVLLDLTMPRMSGEEVLAGMRSIRQNVPVVVITGYGEDAVRDSEREGITGFLQKPFSPDALRAMLQRCAGK